MPVRRGQYPRHEKRLNSFTGSASGAIRAPPGPRYTPGMVHAFLGAAILAAVSIQQVPDPRPSGRVTDQAGVLSPDAEIVLNERAEGIRRDLGHDVLVVTVDNIVGGTPKQFSTALFNLWGIGDAARNDGVLILMVTGQRRLEIETGIGMEAVLTDAWLQSMQQESMVPADRRA